MKLYVAALGSWVGVHEGLNGLVGLKVRVKIRVPLRASLMVEGAWDRGVKGLFGL